MAAKQKGTAQRSEAGGTRSAWLAIGSSPEKNWIAIGVLALLILLLFREIIFGGMIFSNSGDAASFESWSKAMARITETEHTDVFWIPNIFCGMPIFGTLLLPKSYTNLIEYCLVAVIRFIFSNPGEVRDVTHLFLAGVFMFLLARTLKLSYLAALLASLTLMLNPYAVGALEAGQGSKIVVLSFIPLLFLLVYQLLHEKRLGKIGLVGLLGLTGAAIGTSLLSLHPQMEFYAFMMLGCYLIYESASRIKREPADVGRNVGLFLLVLALGIAISAYTYLPAQEYAQYSIRGSGGAGGGASATGGLDYDYATNWSFHPFEMMNYLIPSFFGFSDLLYWGWMPFTESTVYVGIVPLFLAILALIYRRSAGGGALTWFLAIFSCIMLLMSFGRYFPILFNLMFYYFPFFNKFRVPVLILHLMPVMIGALAAFGLTALTGVFSPNAAEDGRINIQKLKKGLTVALILIGALLLIGLVANDAVFSSLSGFMFHRADDTARLQPYGYDRTVLPQLYRMRFDLLWKDYVKFALIAGASIGLVLLYLNRKMSAATMSFGLVAILLIDLLILDTKFIEPKPPTAMTDAFQPDAVVKFLQGDKSIYRVYPIGNLFQDNTWMYYGISSVGGYSPAKIKIYQEMIDSIGLNPGRFPLPMSVLNMLNTKYVVAPGQLPGDQLEQVASDPSRRTVLYRNPHYLQRAYFVDSVIVATSKGQIFAIMNSPSWDSKRSAILEKAPSVQVANPPQAHESTDVRIVKDFSSDIVVQTSCSRPSLLVLSDAYYPAGWKATVDGTETEIYKTNYVIRSVVVPAGAHTVEFTFGPTGTYTLGLWVTNGAWVVTLVMIGIGVAGIRKGKKPALSA